jgi:hypothetical protein
MVWLGSSRAYSPPTVLPAAPSAIFQGILTSNGTVFQWFPPTSGPMPQSFNVYRGLGNNTAFSLCSLVATGVVPVAWSGGGAGACYQLFYEDTTLTSGQAYTYYVTSVLSGVESLPSVALNATALAGQVNLTTNLTTPPAAVINPSTWVEAYSLPAATPVVCTTAAQFVSALAGVNLNGPNVIVMTAGDTFTPGTTGGFQVPAISSSGSLYVISSQDPGYNGSGTLPAYSLQTSLQYQTVAVTATIAAGTGNAAGVTTSCATLTSAWTGATGWWPTVFSSNASNETRLVLYTNGSTAIAWFYPTASSSGTTLYVCVGNWVTPANVASMPTIEFSSSVTGGYGLTVASGANNVRFVGINVTPTPGDTGLNYSCLTMAGPCSGIYADRCIFGIESSSAGLTGASNKWANCRRGITSLADNFFAHQCFVYGFADTISPQDGQGIWINGGGPSCTENCYLEAASEPFEMAGSYVSQGNVPNNTVFRYNYCHNPTMWCQITTATGNVIANWVKNLWESKCGLTGAIYGNIHQNCWAGTAGQQSGRGIVIYARDQTANVNWSSTVSSISGNTLSFTNLNANFAPGDYAWLAGVTGVANQIVQITGVSSPTMTVAQTLGTGTGGTLYKMGTSACPWVSVKDWAVYNNQLYNVNQGILLYSSDYGATACTERVAVTNNLIYINPTPLYGGGPAHGYGLVGQQVPDVLWGNNSVIINPATCLNPSTNYNYGIYGEGNGTALSKWDRITIINDIFDGQQAFNGVNGPTGTNALNTFCSNYAWGYNLDVYDTSSFPTTYGPTYQPIGYTSIGFSDWVSNSTFPSLPSNWNVVTAPYDAASSTGGPLGSTFGLEITTTQASIPTAQVGIPYSLQLEGTGGNSWSATFSPDWAGEWTCPSSGLIQLTPTIPVNSSTNPTSITMVVTYTGTSGSAQATFQITVNPQ